MTITTQSKLKKLSEIRRNPAMATLKMFLEIQETVEKVAKEVIKEEASRARELIMQEMVRTLKDVKEEVRQKSIKIIKTEVKKVKGDKGDPGKDADEEKIIKTVLSKIPPPKKGKDADEKKIVKKVMSLMVIPDPEVTEPETPEETANKLNTLTEAVDKKVIKGLDEMFNVLSQRISRLKSTKKGSGGGMGNIVTQAFSGDGSATSFTLNSRPAGNGTALILLYQGQFLEIGTHFTISGRTITTLFTSDVNTTVFAWYVRG